MKKTTKRTTTLYLTSHDIHSLREIACAMGIIQSRGGGAGQGSISGLIHNIAVGKIALLSLPEDRRQALIDYLVNTNVNDPLLREAIDAVVKALS